MKRLVSARAAARYLGVRNTTFSKWVAEGVIPAHRDPITGLIRFSIPALDEWAKTAGNDNVKAAS